MTTTAIKKSFEEYPFEYEGRKYFLWFDCYTSIETFHYGNGWSEEKTTESRFNWIDVTNIEGAWSLEDAGENKYFPVEPALIRALERSLDVEDFEI